MREHTSVCDRLNDDSNAVKGGKIKFGAIAQLGEHLLCKQRVGGSIPPGSTIRVVCRSGFLRDQFVATRRSYIQFMDVTVSTLFRYLFFKN